jgi:hypothetical protein
MYYRSRVDLMKLFLAVSAVLAFIFGFALLLFSSSFYAPMGIVMTPAIAVTAQAQGAILVGIGVLNWTARSLSGPSVRPVLLGNLVVQVLSLAVISRAVALRIVPAQNAGAIVIHAVLGVGFAYFLARSAR